MRKLALVSMICLVSMPCYGQQTAETTPQQKGQRIGEIVSAAISTAIPGVGPLVNAVWSAFRNRPKDDEKERVTKKIEEEIAAIKRKVSSEIGSIEIVASELEVVGEFLKPTTRATQKLIEIETFLESKNSLSPEDWKEIVEPKWNQVKALLRSIQITERTVKNNVQQISIQTLLIEVLDARITALENADTLIRNNANIAAVRGALAELRPLISGIVTAATLEIASVAADIRSLQAKYNPAMGIVEPSAIDTDAYEQALRDLKAIKGRLR